MTGEGAVAGVTEDVHTLPFRQPQNDWFCGAEVLPSFSCHAVVKQADIENDIDRLRAHLSQHVF